MIDFLIKGYLSIPNFAGATSKHLRQRAIRGAIRLVINWLLSAWFFATRPFMPKGTDEDENFIISLTSFPARISVVSRCIETLLRQKKKPKHIVLWLSSEQFSDKSVLPKSLLKQEKRGLKIELRERDIRSHKKHFYALNEYRELNVITVDDDVLYSSTLTQELCRLAMENPGRIIGNQVKKIGVKNGEIVQYVDWQTLLQGGEKTVNIPIGVGGVLYPAHALDVRLQVVDIFMKLAPKADDLWLGILALLSSVPVIPSGKKELEQIPLTIFSNETLFSTNELGGNDVQLNNILNWAQREQGRNLKQEIIIRNSEKSTKKII